MADVLVVPHRRELRAGEVPHRHGHILFRRETPEMATEVLEKFNGTASPKGFTLHLEYARRVPLYDETQGESA